MSFITLVPTALYAPATMVVDVALLHEPLPIVCVELTVARWVVDRRGAERTVAGCVRRGDISELCCG